jgi:hypothetical protein
MKRVLIVTYSQSGQLSAVLDALAAPLRAAPDVEVVVEQLRPLEPFPFPWTFFDFLDAFPECVHLDPAPITPLSAAAKSEFDLVILGWQVWFLAPSQPIAAFLLGEEGRRILAGRPVVSVVACRNMWLMAYDIVRRLLDAAGARLLDHVALIDRGGFATFLTTPAWLLSGKRDRISWLPRAGIADEDIVACARFGNALVAALRRGDERAQAPLLRGLQAVQVDTRLLAAERIGTRSFRIWGAAVRAAGPPGSLRRRPVLLLYVTFLIAAILTIVPLSMLLRAALRPLLRRRLQRERARYEAPSGSDATLLAPRS